MSCRLSLPPITPPLSEWPESEEAALVEHLHNRLAWHAEMSHALVREVVLSFIGERYGNAPMWRRRRPEDVVKKLRALIDLYDSFKWFLASPGLEYNHGERRYYGGRRYWDFVWKRGGESAEFRRFREQPQRYLRTLQILCEEYEIGRVDFKWLNMAVGEVDPKNPWLGRPCTG